MPSAIVSRLFKSYPLRPFIGREGACLKALIELGQASFHRNAPNLRHGVGEFRRQTFGGYQMIPGGELPEGALVLAALKPLKYRTGIEMGVVAGEFKHVQQQR